jgi:hypothetical protein
LTVRYNHAQLIHEGAEAPEFFTEWRKTWALTMD